MHDVKSCTSRDLLSEQFERKEDFQFGTVSDILTVSSSMLCENAPHVEVTSENEGVTMEKVPCNTFKPSKIKKIRRTSKRKEKQIISPNKFDSLDHKDVQIEENNSQSIKNISLRSETFHKSNSENPWNTVLQSKQGKGKKKCLKYSLDTLKKFETRNPFRLLENISEECVGSVIKRLQEIEYIQTMKKADLKRCHFCNNKKRLCMIDRSNCSAMDKTCVFCSKVGHFPKSLNCKKFRKIKNSKMNRSKLHLSTKENYVNCRYEKENENNDFKQKLKQNEEDTELKRKRCLKCFITHTPYPKFCRWAKAYLTNKMFLDITDELKQEIRKHIELS